MIAFTFTRSKFFGMRCCDLRCPFRGVFACWTVPRSEISEVDGIHS